MDGIASGSLSKPARRPVFEAMIGRMARPFTLSVLLFLAKGSSIYLPLHDSDDSLPEHRPRISSSGSGPTAMVWIDVHSVIHHRVLRPAPLREVSETEHVHRRPVRSAVLFNSGSDDRRTCRLCPVLRFAQLYS